MLGRMGLWTCCWDCHTLIWPYFCVFLKLPEQCVLFLKLPEQCVFLCGNSHLFFYVFHRDSICVVAHVNLMCSLCSWWKDFWSSSLTILPLGFNCGFISTSACDLSTGVCSWGCPGGLGSVPLRARCGWGPQWCQGCSRASDHRHRRLVWRGFFWLKQPPWFSISIAQHSRWSKAPLAAVLLYRWREKEVIVTVPPLHMTQQCCPASMVVHLSSRGISHCDLISLQAISPQSTADLTMWLFSNPYSPVPSCCRFPGTSVPHWGMQGCGIDCPCDYHSIQTHGSAASLPQQPQMPPLCLKLLLLCGDLTLASVPRPRRCRCSSTHCPLFPFLFHSSKFCVDLYIPFWWSWTPACSQLLFCKIFCVLRCIPDTSVETEVLQSTYSSIILLIH